MSSDRHEETVGLGPIAAHFAAQLGIEPAAQPPDLDAAGAAYLANCKRKDCIARFEVTCPDQYKQSDWQHPGLASSAARIQQILAWEYQAKGLLLSGPSGRGKTRAVWALFKRLSEEGREVRLWHATDFFATLQSQVKYGTDDARGWIEAVANRPILILDDLGQESVMAARADWAQSWFFRLLDIRVGAGLPLIVTTNLGAEEIAGRSSGIRSEPLIRRLLDLCEIVKF